MDARGEAHELANSDISLAKAAGILRKLIAFFVL